jgi:ABC-type transporter Mla subunit MlaD
MDELKHVLRGLKWLLKENFKMSQQLDNLTTAINQIRADIASAVASITAKDATIADLQQQLAAVVSTATADLSAAATQLETVLPAAVATPPAADTPAAPTV